MELFKQQSLFAFDVAKLLSHIQSKGLYCSFADAYRDPAMAAIYAKEGKGIQDSLHCKRLAIDLNIFDATGVFLPQDNATYEELGAFWESLNPLNKWGGKFPRRDLDHFQRDEV